MLEKINSLRIGLLAFVVLSCVGWVSPTLEQNAYPKNAQSSFACIQEVVGSLFQLSGNFDRAIAAYQKSLNLNPSQPSVLIYLGTALISKSEWQPALACLQKSLQLDPYNQQTNYVTGMFAQDKGLYNLALECFQRIIEKDPTQTRAFFQMALIYTQAADYPRAIACYERTIQCDPRHVDAYNNLGSVIRFMDLSKWKESIFCFEKAIQLKPNNADAYNNLGSVLRDVGRSLESIACYNKSLEFRPNQASTYRNLSLVWTDLKHFDQAILYLQKALELKPNDPLMLSSLGYAYMEKGEGLKSIVYYEQALKTTPDYAPAMVYLYLQLRQFCLWQEADRVDALLEKNTRNALEKGVFCEETPFINVFRTMDQAENLAVAKAWSDNSKRTMTRPAFTHTPRVRDKLTIGYLSYDFQDHATAHLMMGLFRLHNKKRFNINVYSYGPDDQSDYRRQIAENSTKFVDVAALTDAEVAQRIFDDGVDILVDLKGWTSFARPSIALYRPAPIQIAYLGFPGTSGMDCFDYIITDRIVTPVEDQVYYTEKFLYMKNSYQVNDDQQQISDRVMTRHEVGLPEEGVIFASFNAPYKIQAGIFDSWMRLLSQVPQSVLWLYIDRLGNQAVIESQLRQRAASFGVDPSRIVFANHMKKSDHLRRLQLADLALDVPLYNGHTTTTDALWAGVPVIAIQGDHFASRVSSSLLTAVGLPELITHSIDEYEALVLRLATHPKELANLKTKLGKIRSTSALYNTQAFVEELEGHFLKIQRTLLDQKEKTR
ncbi:MAG: tetratricopeptide repeat protein [Parachlamydiaceae bacterium]